MSNYVKSTNFAIKDGLVTTDPAKIIKGTEIDNEYNAISNAIASKADTNSPALTGTPTVPTAPAGTNTTQIASCAFALANGVPSGCILLWSGSIASIPSGWVLCNGSNSTPDLRNRFVVGAGSTYAVGATGGSANAIVVSHSHTYSGNTGTMSANNTHSHTWDFLPMQGTSTGSGSFAGGSGGSQSTNTVDINHTHSYSGTTSTQGDSATNANLPPYYALAYIMKS
jgi:hypothetical protein